MNINGKYTNLTPFLTDEEIQALREVDALLIRPESNYETMTFDCGYHAKVKIHCDGLIDWLGPATPERVIVFAKIAERILAKRNEKR
jgi:hypothetical protein